VTSRNARAARRKRRTIGAFLHRLHRWMGVTVSLFVILLVLTGVALNHTAELGLARLSVQVPWFSAWYGLRGGVPATGYTASGHWLIAGENGAMLNGKPTAFKLRAPIGMAATLDFVAIASSDELILVDTQGRLVDRVAAAQLPAGPITRIGAARNRIVLQGATKHSSADGLTWTPFNEEPEWSAPQHLPLQQQAYAKHLAPALPFERIMQDVHSGRILGRYGPYLMDAVGLLFLLLAGSGLWMFFRHRRP
jgi:PepSY-associated TM region